MKNKNIQFFILIFIISINLPKCFAKKPDELSIAFDFLETYYTIEEKDKVPIKMKIKIEFQGEYPPKWIIMSLLVNTKDPDIALKSYYNITSILGPWIKIEPNMWSLSKILDEDAVYTPELKFNISEKNWPNEQLVAYIFFSFSYTTINNTYNDYVHLTLKVGIPHIEEVYYYFLNNVFLNDFEKIENNTKISKASLFEWALTHNYTPAEAFSILPLLLNIVYPILLVAFLSLDALYVIITHFIKRNIEININYIIMPQFSLMALLVTYILATKDMIPLWYSFIYKKMNNLLIYFMILTTVTLIISAFHLDAQDS